ncbi:MAG: ABC transporter substrate-binding protein [Omnitrophica bacterium]|nr:ABC transporter substrate-binding protein [Candidatus Omnitrophota bacterium]
MLVPTITKFQNIPKTDKAYGGTLIWGTRNKPTIINPVLITHSVSASLKELIFNSLVRINSKGKIEPDLAESWDISSDDLVYTFHLRKGVRFHDARECTAFDVKFTYDKLIDPKINSPFRLSFQLAKEFKVVDAYTFQIILNKPSVPFIYRLTNIEIMPKHLLEKVDLKDCLFNSHPVGTGPFRFKQWTKEDEITLEYNPDYYEGRPYLDKIIVKTYPTSRDVWAALMRGEVDFVEFIEREDYEILKDDPAFKAYALPIDCYYAISYNPEDSILADRKIRKAITYAVDIKSLIERVAGGYGLESNGPFYPESLGFNPEVKPFEYNSEKAQALLAEAGWKDIDNDGILEKEGEELELKVLIDTRSDIYKRIAMVIRQQLQEIGIKIKLQLYNHEDMLTKEFLGQNRVQAHLRLFLGGTDPDDTAAHWYSRECKRMSRLWTYNNEEIDKLFELGRVTKDKEKRQEIYQKIHQLIYQDESACFLYFPVDFHAVSAKFKGIDEFFTLSMPYYTLRDWHLSTQIITDGKHR